MSEVNIEPEIDKKPDVLWRGFTIDPRTLTAERFSQPLVPGTIAQDDPTRIEDENELGVYMSTNRDMVETAYTQAHVKGVNIQTPDYYNPHQGRTNEVPLPVCGVVIKVDTKGLSIRKPRITQYLKGVYNNGFEGDEYIADSVPPENYKVSRLILTRWANDSDRVIIDIQGSTEEETQAAIEKIQNEFQKREQAAKEFSTFLESLDRNQRLNNYIVEKKWLQHLQEANINADNDYIYSVVLGQQYRNQKKKD